MRGGAAPYSSIGLIVEGGGGEMTEVSGNESTWQYFSDDAVTRK